MWKTWNIGSRFKFTESFYLFVYLSLLELFAIQSSTVIITGHKRVMEKNNVIYNFKEQTLSVRRSGLRICWWHWRCFPHLLEYSFYQWYMHRVSFILLSSFFPSYHRKVAIFFFCCCFNCFNVSFYVLTQPWSRRDRGCFQPSITTLQDFLHGFARVLFFCFSCTDLQLIFLDRCF